MGMTISVVPTELILTLQETKDHLRVTDPAEDSKIEEIIALVEKMIEKHIRRSLLTQTRILTLGEFPDGIIILPGSPVQGITKIDYVDPNGVVQTWSNTEYTLFDNVAPAFVERKFGKLYPAIRKETDAVLVTYVAGYGLRENIPREIRSAALLLVGHFFEHRESIQVGSATVMEMPIAHKTLLSQFKIFTDKTVIK